MIIAAIWVACAVWCVLVFFGVRWIERRVTAKRSPMTHDLCQVCGKELRAKERVEVMVVEDSDEFGGTGWVQTYCKKDRPKVST